MQTTPVAGTSKELTPKAKHDTLEAILAALEKRFYKPELLGDEWLDAVRSHRESIESANSQDDFEKNVTSLLQTLKTSHLGFFHQTAKRASSRAALSATYLADQTEHGSRWIFQDVHDGGAAAVAGIQAGDILLTVDGKDIVPPEHPVFPMGQISTLSISGSNGIERTVTVTVSKPKGKKLQFVEPTLVQTRTLSDGVGYLKVAMFPGMVGVDVANDISNGIAALGHTKRLIIDLRGNTGGGVGALRVMSFLTPDRIQVGFAPSKKYADKDLSTAKLSFPRFGNIPSSKNGLWLLGLRFLPHLITKAPIVLETEGLGPQSFHGNVVILVDRHTASAAEMITIFAKENRLATVVGEETAGRLLSATSVKVGHGFRLALPTGAYYTWEGTALEGKPIQPDIASPFEWQDRRTGRDAQLEAALSVATHRQLLSV